jgi:beta-glucosidase
LDAVKEVVGHETEVIYEQCPSTEFIECNEFSFAIVAIGEAPYAECGGDNTELVIPFNGDEIVDIIADKIPTLVILISGRPLVLEQCLLEKVEALVAAWLPGSEGNGITDVIFGDHDFKGKLPMNWFRRVEQLDQPDKGGNSCDDPLFPLGYGLAYNKENSHE